MQQSKRYQYQAIPARASRYTTGQDVTTAESVPQARRQGCSVTSYFVLGMSLMLILYLVGSLYVLPFLQGLSDHWQYGSARISELDATVNGTPYRFIAQDMGGKIIIVEIAVSNPGMSKLFVAPQTLDRDNLLVTLSIADVNGDGKPDVVISVQGQTSEVVLYGSTGGFSWTEPK